MKYLHLKYGESEHLDGEDLKDLIATVMTLTTVPAPPNTECLVMMLECCLCDGRTKPWKVIHDDILVALHRADDAKPVLLFTYKNLDDKSPELQQRIS